MVRFTMRRDGSVVTARLARSSGDGELDAEAESMPARASSLPHGDQRKLEVAMLMALEPKVYMFDEPTAGMSVDDVPVILDLIRALKAELARLREQLRRRLHRCGRVHQVFVSGLVDIPFGAVGQFGDGALRPFIDQ